LKAAVAFAAGCLLALGCGVEPPVLPEYERSGRAEIPADVRFAHALGEIDGVLKSNSLDAWRLSVDRGFRWFEVDLATTSDSVVVCFHEDHGHDIGLETAIGEITVADFLERRFAGRLELMRFSRLLEEMVLHPETFLITDTKRLSPEILASIVREVDAVDPALRRRIVVQIYHRDELAFVLNSEARGGRFAGVIFTLYQTLVSNDDLVDFVVATDIEWVTASDRRFSAELADRLHSLGVRLFVHTVNSPDRIARLRAAGADGFYTDNAVGGERPQTAPTED
jgi:glycerophosphoryl diester phosphodiesterase